VSVLRGVEEAWLNAERLDEVAFQPLSAQNRVIFKKERIRLGLMTPEEWGEQVDLLRTRLSELLGKPPPRVHAAAGTEFLPRTLEKPQIPFIEEIRYRAFLVAMENLSEEAALEVTRLAVDMEPEKVEQSLIEGKPFNVAEFKPGTFAVLEMKAREMLAADGIAYPL
jgi:hypothetical protein